MWYRNDGDCLWNTKVIKYYGLKQHKAVDKKPGLEGAKEKSYLLPFGGRIYFFA